MRNCIPFVLILFPFFLLAQELKVCSFNIRYDNPNDGYHQWGNRKQIVNDFLAYERLDFVGMQEVLKSQLDEMASKALDYRWIGVGRDDGKEKGEFAPIFYLATKWELLESNTFWLSKTPTEVSKDWDAALPRICTYGLFKEKSTGKEVYVFNTHYDHKGEIARTKSSELILKRINDISGFEKTVLLGDFNSISSDVAITSITSQMKDAYDHAERTYGSIGTFNGFDLQFKPEKRIDYVFFSKEMNGSAYTTDSRVIDGRYLSDHFPVIVEIGY